MRRATDTRQSDASGPASNSSGGAWLIADMCLNVCALSIVKALGLGYPAVQLVFLRSLVGLLVMLPVIWQCRSTFSAVDRPWLHVLRVVLSALTLTASFFAIARLPFAMFTSISFTRPVVTMILAMLVLHEVMHARRWLAAGLAFVGVFIAVDPSMLDPSVFESSWGVPAAVLMVLFGTSAIVLTRYLSTTPVLTMMVFYSVGLTVLTAPFAMITWTPLEPSHWLPLIAIGLFAQAAQFCFLNAHKRAEAAFLSVLGYLSLVLSTIVGFLFFKEVPTLAFIVGSSLIVVAAIWTSLSA